MLIISALLCTFTAGDGAGGTEVKIGGKTGDECIRACIDRKVEDSTINGVTVLSNNKPGCWCEQKMTKTVHSTTYKTCFLTPATGKFDTLMQLPRPVVWVITGVTCVLKSNLDSFEM